MTSIGWKTILQFVGTKTTKIFGLKKKSNPRIFDFCVYSNNVTTKLVFDVFVVLITQSELGGKEP
jgi:hypothetical protein